jgi:lipopolysaccharide exporter
MGGAQIGLRVISMVSTVLLMHVLNPDDFGIVGTAMIVLYTTNLFAGLGLTFAVIQSREDRAQVAYQAFVVTSLAGTLLLVLLLLNVHALAVLLGKASVAPILAWLAPLVFFGGLSMVPEALMQKQMLFARMSAIVVIVEITYVAIALVFAYSGFGLWALVYAALTKSVLTLVLDWWLCPGWEWITRKPWNPKLMKELFGFGIRSTGGGITTFVYSLIDGFTVTRWLGTTQMGYYQKSFDFTSRTMDGLNNVISAVLLPSYAQIQTETDRLSRAYLKSLRLISFLIVPASMGMMIVAPEMVGVVLKPEWAPMVAPFQVLCFASMVKPLSATTSVLFTSTGRPVYNFRAGLVVIAVLVPMIVLLLQYGIVGVAYAVLAAQCAGFLFNMYQMRRILPEAAARMPLAIAPALFAAGLMIAGVFLAKQPLQSMAGGAHNGVTLAVMLVLGGLVYSVTVFLVQRELVVEILGLALGRFKKKQA